MWLPLRPPVAQHKSPWETQVCRETGNPSYWLCFKSGFHLVLISDLKVKYFWGNVNVLVGVLQRNRKKGGLPWWLSGKEFTCQSGRCRFDPWVKNIPWRRKWQPLQYSCCEIPCTEESGGLQSMGLQKSWMWLNKNNNNNIHMYTWLWKLPKSRVSRVGWYAGDWGKSWCR